jgi:DHA2 family multidrug resistance protein
VNTAWENKTSANHADLAGLADSSGAYSSMMADSGLSPEVARSIIDQLVASQSVMLATNEIMIITGFVLIIAAFAVWLAPKPARVVDGAATGH